MHGEAKRGMAATRGGNPAQISLFGLAGPGQVWPVKAMPGMARRYLARRSNPHAVFRGPRSFSVFGSVWQSTAGLGLAQHSKHTRQFHAAQISEARRDTVVRDEAVQGLVEQLPAWRGLATTRGCSQPRSFQTWPVRLGSVSQGPARLGLARHGYNTRSKGRAAFCGGVRCGMTRHGRVWPNEARQPHAGETPRSF